MMAAHRIKLVQWCRKYRRSRWLVERHGYGTLLVRDVQFYYKCAHKQIGIWYEKERGDTVHVII